jgi:predicted transcriptional regulator
MEATNRRRHESAVMTAAHILICLTKEGKSIENIAKDFDNNSELVYVWIDYMIGINWMYKDRSDNKWIATENGKKWIERYYDIKDN